MAIRYYRGFIFLLIFFASLTYFSQTPFVQHEILGQAYHYACDPAPLLTKLFDPIRNDEFAGRFRYIEYLAEAAYWNLAQSPLFPKTPFDYLAFISTIFCVFLLIRYFHQFNLPFTSQLFLIALFLFSIPTFMVITWHYRKAKFLSSLFFLIIISLENSTPKIKHPIIALTILLGFFTDPYFITIMAIYLVVSWTSKEKSPDARFVEKSMLFAILFGMLLVFLFNALLGPAFNPASKFILKDLEIHNAMFLNWKAIPYFPLILTQTFGLLANSPFLSWIVVFILALLLWKPISQNKILKTFFLSLPVFAFLVSPLSLPSNPFLSYYGHLTFTLFTVSASRLIYYYQDSKTAFWATHFFLVLILFFHVANRNTVFTTWTLGHTQHSEYIAKNVKDDVRLIGALSRRLSLESQPIQIQLPYSNLTLPKHFGNSYRGLGDTVSNTTPLSLILIPILFQREIRANHLQIYELLGQNKIVWKPECSY